MKKVGPDSFCHNQKDVVFIRTHSLFPCMDTLALTCSIIFLMSLFRIILVVVDQIGHSYGDGRESIVVITTSINV